ncbi:MAG TPA: polyprenyl synthetase family protein [Jatrophihabitantaceae bacterium]|jgi:geranylgeranyl diphosphate synthase type I|nr:polyprenyl synthetase family protein [Jatrophihabitantaceae bacterium]
MSEHRSEERARNDVRSILESAGELVAPAMRRAVDGLDDRMRLIASYQLGWCDKHGNPTPHGGGKGLRPTMAVLSAVAGGGSAADGVPGAVAVELVHNFSLLHDDVMDRDLERRHRPTGWVAFGEGQAILGGNAMFTLAVDVLLEAGEGGFRGLPCLTGAVQQLITGQSDDLAFENAGAIDLHACLRMEAGKTAALMACAASIGALCAGAPEPVVDGLAGFGFELGIAFQLVDDILGITGEPSVTGKSASSDVRVGKRSAPIVAALSSESDAGAQLEELLGTWPPRTEDDVVLATKLINEAGGLRWAAAEAQERLTVALAHLCAVPEGSSAVADLVTLARYVLERDH